jgi:hypothetical protein
MEEEQRVLACTILILILAGLTWFVVDLWKQTEGNPPGGKEGEGNPPGAAVPSPSTWLRAHEKDVNYVLDTVTWLAKQDEMHPEIFAFILRVTESTMALL